MGDLTDDAISRAEQLGRTHFQGTNCIGAFSKLTEAQLAAHAALEQHSRSLVESPTEIECSVGQEGDPIESLPLDTQAGAVEVGTNWPRVSPIESIGSYLDPSTIRFAQRSHPDDTSEDEWPVLDNEACSPTKTDQSRTVGAPSHL